MSVSLLPIATNASPKDFRAIADKIKASTEKSGQTYKEFPLTDEVSLSQDQRETYRGVLGQIEATLSTAGVWKKADDANWPLYKDLDPAPNQVHIIVEEKSNFGNVIQASYDSAGQPTRFSLLAAGGGALLLQQDHDSLIFANLNGPKTAGLLFDKSTDQGILFTAS